MRFEQSPLKTKLLAAIGSEVNATGKQKLLMTEFLNCAEQALADPSFVYEEKNFVEDFVHETSLFINIVSFLMGFQF